jgi:hypothetical protein
MDMADQSDSSMMGLLTEGREPLLGNLGLAASEFVHDTVIIPNYGPDEPAIYQKIQISGQRVEGGCLDVPFWCH